MDTLIFAAVFVVGAVYVAHPLLIGGRAGQVEHGPVHGEEIPDELVSEKEALYDAIRDLDFEYETGKLSDEDHADLRRSYRLRALELLGRMDARPDFDTLGAPGSSLLPAFCGECGTPVQADDQFCATCGASVRPLPSDPPVPMTTASDEPGGSP